MEAGFADAGPPHDGDDLPLPRPGLPEGPAQPPHLRGPADEPSEAAPRGSLQARAYRTDTGDFVDLDGLGATFDPYRTKRLRGDEAFNQLARRRRDQHRTGPRGLFHAGGEMCRLPDRRV